MSQQWRNPVWPGPSAIREVRDHLLERDGDKCWLCGERVCVGWLCNGWDVATIDHIIPVSLGGGNDFWNLRIAHSDCNGVRSNCMDPDCIASKIAKRAKRRKRKAVVELYLRVRLWKLRFTTTRINIAGWPNDTA